MTQVKGLYASLGIVSGYARADRGTVKVLNPTVTYYPASELVIDPVLIRKYDVSGPRYTSYPTADRFVEAFAESDFRHWLGKRNIGGISQPLSVYVHPAVLQHPLLLLRLQ